VAETRLATISRVRSSAKFVSLCSSRAWVRTSPASSVGRKTCLAFREVLAPEARDLTAACGGVEPRLFVGESPL
jgi:hypothetical protein